MRKVNNINCCVYGCHSKKGRNNLLSFHHFPKEKRNFVYVTNKLGIQEKMDRKKAWELKLLMGKPITPYMRVCSLHFRKSDYLLPDMKTKRPRLKQDAVPSQNLPRKRFTTLEHHRTLVKRVKLQNPCSTSETYEAPNEIAASRGTRKTITNEEKIAVEALLNLNSVVCEKNPSTAEKSIQVKSGDIITPFVSCIDSDSKLCSLTGLHSFVMLESLVSVINDHFPNLRTQKLTTKERIIMTFMKLKTGLRYVCIASLFATVTGKTCKIIFHGTISKLAVVLKPLILWPSVEECRGNLPKCFEPFPNVRVILDCTEIAVQKSPNLCCRILTYSHYKGTQTIKFMTGVSPAGLITFISRAYGGRTSDKAIFEQSKIIEKLNYGSDAIMVDKGFRIDNIAQNHRIHLIRPPFLKSNMQLTEEDALLNASIARARVHIERTNQRIKTFELLTKPLPLSLVPKIEDSFSVICAIVNLSSPILGDDKFQ